MRLALIVLLFAACTPSPKPAPPPEPVPAPEPTPAPEVTPAPAPTPAGPVVVGNCSPAQADISAKADARAAPSGILPHLEKDFPGRSISWVMPDGAYQKYIVTAQAKNFGRCNADGCFQFGAPTGVLEKAIADATTADGHDPAILGKALGLPPANVTGTLRLVTLDAAATNTCLRLPVEEDPGVDKSAFVFGGYTSGGVPEVMVIDAPVDKAVVKEIK